MTDRNVHHRTLVALAEYFGGYSTLALILNVGVDELQGWAAGTARPPASVYPRLMDLVLQDPHLEQVNALER